MESDKGIRHLIQTLLSQVVDVNNFVRAQQDNKELAEADKIATTNFAHYHLMVLSILLHDIEDIVREKFPDNNSRGIMDWAMEHYANGLERKSFTPCKCKECHVESPVVEAEVV